MFTFGLTSNSPRAGGLKPSNSIEKVSDFISPVALCFAAKNKTKLLLLVQS